MNFKNSISVVFLFLIVFLFFNNCDKDPADGYYYIPEVPVNRTVNLNLPSYQQLSIPGNYFYFPNDGYRGIILYHSIDDTYIAFERACTYRPDDDCSTISVDHSGTYMKCGKYEGNEFITCCQSQFDMDGFVMQGPAKYPLKQYQVTRSGSVLYITN